MVCAGKAVLLTQSLVSTEVRRLSLKAAQRAELKVSLIADLMAAGKVALKPA